MFIKLDKMPMETIKTKPPRAIQYRAPEFNLKFSRFIKAFEHYYYENLTYGTSSRVVAKGLNQVERAQLLIQKAERFVKPIYLLLDHSAFDASIGTHWLKQTHRKYLKSMPYKKLHKLLKAQLVNHGYTKFGHKYMVKGTRMSGEADTGCGNVVVNLDAIYYVMLQSLIKNFEILVDGDDSIVIIEEEDLKLLRMEIFERLGFKTKLEVAYSLETAEFCQSRIVFTNPPKFVRNPCRAVSHATCTPHTYSRDKYDEWMNAVGTCEVSLNSGVPVLQTFGQSLITGENMFWTQELRERMSLETVRGAEPITDQVRLSFYRAWGISPELQRELETVITYRAFKRFTNSDKNDESIQRARSLLERRFEPGSSCWWCGCKGRGKSVSELGELTTIKPV